MKKSVKNLVFTMLMSAMFFGACGSEVEEVNNNVDQVNEQLETNSNTALYTEGTYTGESDSIGGKIKLDVTVDENEIQSIEIVEFNDSEFSFDARDNMIEKIVNANNTNIDTISGATETTQGIINAVDMALLAAYIDSASNNVNIEAEDEPVVVYEDIETDVVIIGGGGAGLSAAISAKEQGSDVVLVEKLSFLGGNTNYATGGLNAAETEQQKALGIEDSIEVFYDDTMKGGKDVNNPQLVHVLTSNAKDTVNWLTNLGADLNDVGVLGGSTNNRTHRPTGGAPVGNHIVNVLSENAEKLEVDVKVSTTAMEVLVEDNEAKGVIVETENGEQYTIFADAVIIATGGFGANNDLVASFVPDLKGYGTTNAPGATGDVLAFTENLNLELVDMEEIQTHPTVMPSNNYMITEAVRGTGAILINREGNRFIDELETRDVVSNAELAQTGQTAFLVFDQNVRDNLSAINGYYEKGFLMEAESIEELSGLLELPEGILNETVSTYNTYVVSGDDVDFGRTKMESTIEMAPFYAVEVGPAVHHTMGGVKIDTEARVYNNEGEYIHGLYACGEVTGGVHGANRLGGNAMADITVFGYIAGEGAAAYSQNK